MKLPFLMVAAALVACDPRTNCSCPPVGAGGASGSSSSAGGEASSTISTSGSLSASSASSSASVGAGGSDGGGPACVEPHPRGMDYRCRFDTDCYDGSPCTIERCVEGGCVYESLPDNSRCDAGAFRGTCRALAPEALSSCCPVVP